jgi:hemerythrin-like domain-containing protein
MVEHSGSGTRPDGGNALEHLSATHFEAHRCCTRLEQLALESARPRDDARTLRTPTLLQIIEFFDIEVERHRFIEDSELFPRLLALSLPAPGNAELRELIVALREDHRLLALMWRELRPLLLLAAQRGDSAPAAEVATFVTVYRQHMNREDAGIFPFARRYLDAAALAAISDAMHAAIESFRPGRPR